MKSYRAGTNIKAVTLTELLVVLVIITLLATIAIPVYVNKSQQARIATAQREVREIAQAMEQCGLTHGFYVPIQVLDNLHPDVNLATVNEDSLDNENEASIFLINVATDPELQDGAAQLNLQDRQNNALVAKLYNEWAGPFLNVQRYFGKEIVNPSETVVRRDYPLDPWGQPYRMYSPLGVVGDGATAIDPDTWDSDSVFNGALTLNDPRFDRYAIVSLGPDGDGFDDIAAADDIVYVFGALLTESSFAAFR